jgi:hypothetical protein
MIPSAALIVAPAIDWGRFLGLAQQMLGSHRAFESSPIQLSDTEQFLDCLTAFSETSGLSHVSFSVLFAAEERDFCDLLQVSVGMPFVATDSVVRGIKVGVLSGTLAQWREAVKAGSSKQQVLNVRAFFNAVMRCFQAVRIDPWKDCESHSLNDTTLYLTDKR